MHTEALVRLFWNRRTIGFKDKNRQRRMLSSEQWGELLYKWAREVAMKRFNA
jgi:hypothetical protein